MHFYTEILSYLGYSNFKFIKVARIFTPHVQLPNIKFTSFYPNQHPLQGPNWAPCGQIKNRLGKYLPINKTTGLLLGKPY